MPDTVNRYTPFRCELSPCSESIKNRCYVHYRLYRLHPLVRKSYRRPIIVTQTSIIAYTGYTPWWERATVVQSL